MNLHQLLKLANDRSYARGELYFKDGHVRSLARNEGALTAIVSGQNDYHVEVRFDEDEVEYSCDCPIGLEGEFCKHLVAACLASMESDPESGAKSGGKQKKRTAAEAELRAYLGRQDKDTLIAILTRETLQNRKLLDRLLLEAARVNPAGLDLAAYRRAIAKATRTNGFVDYHSARDYVQRIHQVVESIAHLCDSHAPAVIELTEYALAKLEGAIGEMDDSDGHMGILLPELQGLHHQACLTVMPERLSLARRLFSWEMKSDWEIFYGAAERYADVFGTEGLAEYRRLAEPEWAKVRQLGPGDRDDDRTWRFRITSIMEALARQTGDPEALVEIKRRDLSHAYAYFQIAEIYREAGLYEKALDWAEQGTNSFSQRDPRLDQFLAHEYQRRGRYDDAMTLIWNQFAASPVLKSYQELEAHALKVRPHSDWPAWRSKALTHLRMVVEKRKEKDRDMASAWHWSGYADNSRLVEILLWEKRHDDAWEEATAGGCSVDLWRQVAAVREEKHPGDAVSIYKEMITPILEQTKNSAYVEAIKLLRRIRELMGRLGRVAEFESYLAALRVEYKRKRNFIKLLDKIEGYERRKIT